MRIGSPSKVYALVALLAAGCSSGSSSMEDMGQPASKVVGTSGGAVTSTDGALEVALPAGALAGDVTITVAAAAAPAAGAVGATYEIGPTGTQFAMPVTMKLSYEGVDLHGATASSLRVATYAAGSWQILAGAQVDTEGKTVSGLTTHLSPYAIVTATEAAVCATVRGPAPLCAGTGPTLSGSAGTTGGGTNTGTAGTTGTTGAGATNGGTTTGSGGTTGTTGAGATSGGTTTGTAGATGTTGAGATSGGGGITGDGTTGAGATSGGTTTGTAGTTGGGTNGAGASSGDPSSTCEAAETCAAATDICGAYPGATAGSCTDGTAGYTAACCFAPAAPICFAIQAYSSPCTSAGGGSCAPPVTCATAAAPCAAYPGAQFQGCTDVEHGYTGSCCFANDAPICVKVGGGGCNGPGCTPLRCATANPCGQVTGATVGSCTDTADGFEASCCFAPRTLPPPVGSHSPSGGIADAGTTNPGTDAGISGGSDGGTGGPTDPGGSRDAGQPPPPFDGGATTKPDADVQPPADDAGQPPPPPPYDGGATTKPDADVPPPADDAGQPPPPPPYDGGAATKPDADVPPPPPPPLDGGAAGGTCNVKPMPSDGTAPCGVSEFCPASGTDYAVRCNPGDTTCTCMTMGQPTGSVAGSCTSFDPVALLTGCGFPVP